MPDEFYTGTDWEQSSGPMLTRNYDASADLWPHGAGSEIGAGDKDVLANGLHPILAIGATGNRPNNLTGVVLTYYSEADIAILNVADKYITRQYVANIVSYAATYSATYVIGMPVFVDSSADLSAGVTLSLSPLDSGGAGNPLAGYLHYCQDEYQDVGFGGPNVDAVWPKTASNSVLVESLLCVIQVNDSGQAQALIAEAE